MRPHEKYIDAVKVVLSPLDLHTHLTLCIWSPDLMSRGFRRDLMPAFLCCRRVTSKYLSKVGNEICIHRRANNTILLLSLVSVFC